jgi:mannose/fructose/N-acetylgalactosamine-specific phosphotransferase system component IIB
LNNKMFVRVDERLLHGQILLKWLDNLSCKEAIILNDELADDPVTRSIMRTMLPRETSLLVYGVQQGIDCLKVTSFQENILILVKEIVSLYRLVEARLPFVEANIAKLPREFEKIKLSENIYVSEEEQKMIRLMLEKGIVLFSQMVPDSKKIFLKNVWEG